MMGNTQNLLGGVLGLFGGIGPWEVVVILAVLLLLFGGKKLPELARGLGKGLRHFKEELSGVQKSVEQSIEGEGDDKAERDPHEADDEPRKLEKK